LFCLLYWCTLILVECTWLSCRHCSLSDRITELLLLTRAGSWSTLAWLVFSSRDTFSADSWAWIDTTRSWIYSTWATYSHKLVLNLILKQVHKSLSVDLVTLIVNWLWLSFHIISISDAVFEHWLGLFLTYRLFLRLVYYVVLVVVFKLLQITHRVFDDCTHAIDQILEFLILRRHFLIFFNFDWRDVLSSHLICLILWWILKSLLHILKGFHQFHVVVACVLNFVEHLYVFNKLIGFWNMFIKVILALTVLRGVGLLLAFFH